MSEQPARVRIPEGMGPQEFGPYIRQLREYFKLSQQDIAARIHIRARYVQAIEEGRYDAMPGGVYARGYVHTYAEFLGLDADQVVAELFRGQPAPAARSFVPPPAPAPNKPIAIGGIWPVLILLGLGVLGYMALSGTETAPTEPAAPSVAPVPDAMLETMRVGVMPTPQNFACVNAQQLLPCLRALPPAAIRPLPLTGDFSAESLLLQGSDDVAAPPAEDSTAGSASESTPPGDVAQDTPVADEETARDY